MKRRYRDVLRVLLLRTASDTNVPLVPKFISVKLAIGQFFKKISRPSSKYS